jgi:hypothetical protein
VIDDGIDYCDDCGWFRPECRCRVERGSRTVPPWVTFPQLAQRQDDLTAQLTDLLAVAVRLGMYDAADWLTQSSPRWRRHGVPSPTDGTTGPTPT